MIVAEKDYIKLTKRLPLISIRDDAHLREANAILIELSGKDMTTGERDYFRVLAKLTGEYEKDIFPSEPMTPVEVFQYLMEENSLTRAQMGEIIGCRANRVTEILNGNRELSKEHIGRLSARFKVSTDLFLPVVMKKAS
jgi:antitoxin component HigA of HigAB toxin-antitoxin module